MFSPTLYLRFFFFFNDTATTEIYTLSLHDALPISQSQRKGRGRLHAHRRIRRHYSAWPARVKPFPGCRWNPDRKSTRLNSSHGYISYAVFCLKKKKTDKSYRWNQLHDLLVRSDNSG